MPISRTSSAASVHSIASNEDVPSSSKLLNISTATPPKTANIGADSEIRTPSKNPKSPRSIALERLNIEVERAKTRAAFARTNPCSEAQDSKQEFSQVTNLALARAQGAATNTL